MTKHLTYMMIIISILGFTSNEDYKDYLSIPNTISFEKELYSLKWSNASASNHHYKQEYLRSKESLEAYNKMIFFEVLHDKVTPKDLVNIKVKELEKRRSSDPVINYQILDNDATGEYLIDFLVSEGDLYEWNVYRYKTIQTNKGKAMMLFAFILRSNETSELDADRFFSYLKKNRTNLIEAIAELKLPSVRIKE